MKSKGRNSILKKIIGTLCIPVVTLLVMILLCQRNGVVFFESEGNWILFFRATATVMLTTFALSLNLNSGRFDFSIGAISLLSSVISASICSSHGLSTPYMLVISIVSGALLGLISGAIYVIVKLPPIIVSLGVTLFYEGIYHNPITNVRTYGDDPEKVYAYAREYLRAADECNMAVSIKHFPGDGVDERDQHLLTSVNSLSMEEWDKSYGSIYQRLIDDGAKTVMAGHIAMPAYQEHFNPQLKGKIVPASLSRELLVNLLRDKLGFNGLVITDATPMVGFTAAGKRSETVPMAIENGCDMILFNKDLKEDYQFMLDGYKNGLLSRERLLDANRRILALKASLRLHEKKIKRQLVPGKEALKNLRTTEHIQWAKELADQSVTLVKDIAENLPISAKKTPRILLEILGHFPSNERVVGKVKEELEKRNFQVFLYEKEDFEKGVDNVTAFKDKYDMVIYIGNVENASNQTTNRLNWYTFWGQGNNVPWFAEEVPVIFISVANPYHLLDVPMIKTYINCYSNNDYVLEAVIAKIAGESRFKGVSPVDPFCGRIELSY